MPLRQALDNDFSCLVAAAVLEKHFLNDADNSETALDIRRYAKFLARKSRSNLMQKHKRYFVAEHYLSLRTRFIGIDEEALGEDSLRSANSLGFVSLDDLLTPVVGLSPGGR